MDHLQQAKFHLDRAITAEWKADLQALCGIGHALVAGVELLQQKGAYMDMDVENMDVRNVEIHKHLDELSAEKLAALDEYLRGIINE